MKNPTSQILKLSMFLIMMLSLVGIAMAADPNPTLITTTWTNAIVNLSVADGNNVTYVTVYASSASTANSSTSLIANITNTTATNFMFGYANFSLNNDIVLEDSNNYAVSFVTTGTTAAADGEVGTSATGVTVSRTTPTAATTTQSQNSVLANDAVLTYTVVGTTTTGCRIAFLSDGSPIRFTGTDTFAMTHSGDSCTYTASKANVRDSDYAIYVQASDGSDTAQSSKLTVKYDAVKGGSAGGAYVVAQQAQQKQNNNVIIYLIAGVAIWAIATGKIKI